MNDKFKLISTCIETGDWSLYDEAITRKDLMDYLIAQNTDIVNKNQQLKCPLCEQTIKSNKFTMTHRAVKYLMIAAKLGKKEDGTYDYVNYEDVRLLTKKVFDVNFTSYALLTKSPWNLLETRVDSNDKVKRDGYFRLTDKGYKFLRGQINVPETIWILKNKVIKHSNNTVNAVTVKTVDFKSCVNLLKSF